MAKKDVIEAVGTVVDAQPNAMFKVRLENTVVITDGEPQLLTLDY